jgi:hypothetical protein
MREAWGGGEWRNIHYLFTVETEEMVVVFETLGTSTLYMRLE